MRSFTSLLLQVYRGIRLHGISSRRGSPQYCSPQAPLGINDASSSINSCKFLSTVAATWLWQHRGFCPACAIRGKGSATETERHQFLRDILLICSTPLTTYLGFPDFNIPTGAPSSLKLWEDSKCQLSLPKTPALFPFLWDVVSGVQWCMSLHIPLIEPRFLLPAKYYVYQNKWVRKFCRNNGSPQPFLIIQCIKLLWEKPY